MDHVEAAYGVYCANAAHAKRPFAPIDDPERSAHAALVPFTGEGNLQVTITAGQVIRVCSSPYTYDGGAQYAIGNINTPVSGSDAATTNLGVDPGYVVTQCPELSSTLTSSTSTRSNVIPWFGTDLGEAGIGVGGLDGPQAQLSSGFLTVEAICAENSSCVGCAVGQHEVRGWGPQNNMAAGLGSGTTGLGDGALLPGNLPFFQVEATPALVYGGLFNLKQRDTVVGSTSVARRVWAVPVTPTVRTYMNMQQGNADGRTYTCPSALLNGSEGGGQNVYNSIYDLTRTTASFGNEYNPFLFLPGIVGNVALYSGQTLTCPTTIRRRACYAVPNVTTCGYAGCAAVEIHCLTGTSIINIGYKMHYNVVAPTSHPNYEQAILNIPIAMSAFPLAIRAASHAGSGSTANEAVSNQKRLSANKFGGSHAVMDAFHSASPAINPDSTRPPIMSGSGLKSITYLPSMSPSAIVEHHLDVHPSIVERAGSVISSLASNIWSGVKWAGGKALPSIAEFAGKHALQAAELGGAAALMIGSEGALAPIAAPLASMALIPNQGFGGIVDAGGRYAAQKAGSYLGGKAVGFAENKFAAYQDRKRRRMGYSKFGPGANPRVEDLDY